MASALTKTFRRSPGFDCYDLFDYVPWRFWI
jgi:hypothetical protein